MAFRSTAFLLTFFDTTNEKRHVADLLSKYLN